MLDRRHFLIGAGALLSASFVTKATAFSRDTGKPLILPSVRKPEETLYVYEVDENDEVVEYAKWRVSLGPDQPVAPPPPTWREYLRSRGHRLDTDDDIARVCAQNGSLTLEELDRTLDAYGWQDIWDNFTGPQAKEHHLLKKLDLGAPDSKLKQSGEIIFQGFGGGPGNSYTWVELQNDLTVWLLQARLIELNLPIKVKLGTLS